MNLLSKVLLLSCIITSGLHCGFPEESLMEKQGMSLEIIALLKVLKHCHQRDIYSLKKGMEVKDISTSAFQAYATEQILCENTQEALRKIIDKIKNNH